jgi:anthranilate synthase/aminodeoxychorismate synthase-like glutamine amidotransferase
MIFMIDNYDSFTFNLVQYFQEMGEKVKVFRNDKVTVSDIERMKPDCLVISPGPGYPQQAGISVEAVRHFVGRIPILGVCLGHQAIGHAFGARIGRARRLMHGKVSRVRHDGRRIFRGLENPFEATRYHSLSVQREGLPDCLRITATSEGDEIMAVRHKRHAVEGVQFHPESILTTCGKQLLRNFLTSYRFR